MPQRPDHHVVADMALESVIHICVQCGWACEPVHKDYGDDVLVQTSYNGMLDYSRIWIQVKGTRNINRFYSKKNGYSMKVSLDHALKWVRSADLVVVVLWDVEKNFGLWSIPKDSVDEWDWYLLKTEKSRLIFKENSLFDVENALKIGWIARVNHYQSLLNNALDRDLHYQEFPHHKPDDYKDRAPLITFDFLRLVQILDDEFIDMAFYEYYRNTMDEIRKKHPDEPEDMVEGEAAMLSILRWINYVSKGCGVPTTLLVNCTNIAMKFIQLMEK